VKADHECELSTELSTETVDRWVIDALTAQLKYETPRKGGGTGWLLRVRLPEGSSSARLHYFSV